MENTKLYILQGERITIQKHMDLRYSDRSCQQWWVLTKQQKWWNLDSCIVQTIASPEAYNIMRLGFNNTDENIQKQNIKW